MTIKKIAKKVELDFGEGIIGKDNMGDGSRSHSIWFVHNQSGISDSQCESPVNGSYEVIPILHSASPAYTSPSTYRPSLVGSEVPVRMIHFLLSVPWHFLNGGPIYEPVL